MKQIITLMAAAILTSTVVKAQYDIEVDFSASTCVSDLEIKVFTTGGTNTGESNWFAIPSSFTTYDRAAISAGPGWVTDPGAASIPLNDWYFDRVIVRNCNGSIGTSGTPGMHCGSTNTDGVDLSGHGGDCFIYSTNCGTCNSGQEMQVNMAAGSAGGGTANVNGHEM